ncbi:hypothetical protein PG984_010244 [Apiospora sp. TS-2023a]
MWKEQYQKAIPFHPALNYSFVGFTLDKVNLPPGSKAIQTYKSERAPSQRNNNNQEPGPSSELWNAIGQRDFRDPSARTRTRIDDDDDYDMDYDSDDSGKSFAADVVDPMSEDEDDD